MTEISELGMGENISASSCSDLRAKIAKWIKYDNMIFVWPQFVIDHFSWVWIDPHYVKASGRKFGYLDVQSAIS